MEAVLQGIIPCSRLRTHRGGHLPQWFLICFHFVRNHSLRFPELLCRFDFIISEERIHPNKKGIKDARPLNDRANGSVDPSRGLVIGAHTDAIGAIHAVLTPERKTFFSIDIPLQDTRLAGDVMSFGGPIAKRDGLRGAVRGTFLTGFAEFSNTKRMIDVDLKREICKDFTEAHPGTICFRDQQSHAASLPQSRSHGQGDA